jgi:hypothetical protein
MTCCLSATKTFNHQPSTLTMKGTQMPNPNSFAELDDFYQQTLDYLYLKYHSYPDLLPQIPLSEQAQAELAGYERLAASLSEGLQALGAQGGRLNRDPRYSNGLPRRRLRP